MDREPPPAGPVVAVAPVDAERRRDADPVGDVGHHNGVGRRLRCDVWCSVHPRAGRVRFLARRSGVRGFNDNRPGGFEIRRQRISIRPVRDRRRGPPAGRGHGGGETGFDLRHVDTDPVAPGRAATTLPSDGDRPPQPRFDRAVQLQQAIGQAVQIDRVGHLRFGDFRSQRDRLPHREVVRFERRQTVVVTDQPIRGLQTQSRSVIGRVALQCFQRRADGGWGSPGLQFQHRRRRPKVAVVADLRVGDAKIVL